MFSLTRNSLPNGEYNIIPVFMKKIRNNNDDFEFSLKFELISKEEVKTPYDINLIIVGTFELKDYTSEDLNTFLNINAIQILFPYMRSTLSSAMAALMLPPIVLPVMDARSIVLTEEEN